MFEKESHLLEVPSTVLPSTHPRPNLVGSPNVLNKMTDKRAHIQIEKFERVAAIALEDDWITLLVDTPTKTVPVEYTIADMVEFQ